MQHWIYKAFSLLILLTSHPSMAGDTGDNLIDDPVLPGHEDEYTREANKIIENLIIKGISTAVANTPVRRYNPRFPGSGSSSPKQCLNTTITNGHTIASFATTGGLRNLYKWVSSQEGWQFALNDHGASPLAIAIEQNLFYMAKDIWASGHPYAYNKSGFGLTLSYMVHKKWPLRGFEAAWDNGERFNDDGIILYDRGHNAIFIAKPKYKRSEIVNYLREKETNPENYARLQTLLNKFEAAPSNSSIKKPLAALGSFAHARITGGDCHLARGVLKSFEKALDNEVIDEKIAMSFNIHGRPLIHYFIDLRLGSVAKEFIKEEEYASQLMQRRDHKGRNALLTAMEARNTEITGMILDIEPSMATQVIPDQENYLHVGDSLLHIAIRQGTPVETIKQLLKHSNRELLTYEDAKGFTPSALLEHLYNNEDISGDRYLAVRKAMR